MSVPCELLLVVCVCIPSLLSLSSYLLLEIENNCVLLFLLIKSVIESKLNSNNSTELLFSLTVWMLLAVTTASLL